MSENQLIYKMIRNIHNKYIEILAPLHKQAFIFDFKILSLF